MPLAPRVSVRKPHGFRLGRKVTSILVGPKSQPFTIHDSLLCKTSKYFRNALQPKRRLVEGECSICHKALVEDSQELTYCSASCGGNFHFLCMEEWKQRAMLGVAECPLCRSRWVEPVSATHQFKNVSESSLEVYSWWLYNRKSLAPYYDDDLSNDLYVDVIDAHALGVQIDDQEFCYAVLQCVAEMCFERKPIVCFLSGMIEEAYDVTTEQCSLRRLLVGLYMKTSRSTWVEVEWPFLPNRFKSDLALELMRIRAGEVQAWDVDEIMASYVPQPPPTED